MIGRLWIRYFVFLERYPKFLHSAIASVDKKQKKNHLFQKKKGTLCRSHSTPTCIAFPPIRVPHLLYTTSSEPNVRSLRC
ncbi:hypothetical protein KC316_g86 [Hortaea werneckii]|nr:hypothetical protein KC316_g86 [Hortaea werneckii]